MKKLISTLAATMLVATSLGAVSVSASEENMISLTTTVLDEAIIADNGEVIPVGATAVSVKITDNTGFSTKTVRFNISSANVLTNADGSPIVDCGCVIGDSIIGSSLNNEIMAISSVSINDITDDGEIFTFYVNSNADNISVLDVDPIIVNMNIGDSINIRPTYVIGDVNGDGYIDSIDASSILGAIANYRDLYFDDALPVGLANTDLSYYFPYNTPPHAGVADSNDNLFITNYDAQCVMNYYSAMATGQEPDNSCGYCGEIRHYTPINTSNA